MPDPSVTSIVGADGVERWGAVDAKWVRDAQEPPAVEAVPQPAAPAPDAEVTTDATEDAPDGDGPNPRRSRR